jgi:hypothetical protein
MTTDVDTAESQPNELQTLEAIVARATAAGFENELVLYTGEDYEPDDPGYVRLKFPNGRKQRSLLAVPSRASRLMAMGFEHFIFLGDHEAFVDTASGIIEAQVSPSQGAVNARTALWALPGVEVLDDEVHESEEAADEAEVATARRPEKWRLLVDHDGQTIELSPATERAKSVWPLQRTRVTIKLEGFATATHDEALAVLERYANAMLFELDVLYGVPATLVRKRPLVRRTNHERAEHEPRFPVNKYAQEALALYQYARTANGLPLLEYLAYYQSLEFFFPIFAREQTVKSLRTAILSPRFNPTDDAAVNRLINLAAPAVRAGLAEREQLRATVRACVENDELRDLIQSSEMHNEHFCSKKQVIRGVSAIRLDGDQSDLRDQVADRIYAIRCRVVHTKQDGGGPGDELLLPSSSETESLRIDIELVRLVAQRALFARAARA